MSFFITVQYHFVLKTLPGFQKPGGLQPLLTLYHRVIILLPWIPHHAVSDKLLLPAQMREKGWRICAERIVSCSSRLSLFPSSEINGIVIGMPVGPCIAPPSRRTNRSAHIEWIQHHVETEYGNKATDNMQISAQMRDSCLKP